MSSRRTLMMVVAVVVAALAGAAIYTFLGDITQKKEADEKQVSVWVVDQRVERLALGSTVKFKSVKVPARLLPEGAITTDNPGGLEKEKQQIAAQDIPARTILTDGLFVDRQEVTPSGSYRLQKDYVAVSVSLDQVHGLGGIVQPGDYVNILATVTPPNDDSGLQVTSPLYQKAFVLYIGDQPAPQPGEATDKNDTEAAAVNTGIITFEVPPSAAQRIAAASGAADFLTLTLVNPKYEPVELPAITNIPSYSGFDIQELVNGDYKLKTPYKKGEEPQ